jgi:uncharacterized protein
VTVVVDTGFLVALLSRRDDWHAWAIEEARRRPRPWETCEAVLTEAFHLVGSAGSGEVAALLERGALRLPFSVAEQQEGVLALMRKYANVPMSFADACIVRMCETRADAIVLTTDSDFRIYRRHGRQTVPCILPR